MGGAGFGLASGLAVCGLLKTVVGIRLDQEQKDKGADLSLHRITASPEDDAPGM